MFRKLSVDVPFISDSAIDILVTELKLPGAPPEATPTFNAPEPGEDAVPVYLSL